MFQKKLGIVYIILILSFGYYVVIFIVKDWFNAHTFLAEAVKNSLDVTATSFNNGKFLFHMASSQGNMSLKRALSVVQDETMKSTRM